MARILDSSNIQQLPSNTRVLEDIIGEINETE